jgi:glutamyl-tRNA synthetase
MPPNEALAIWREKKPAMRFKVPAGKTTTIHDHVRGDVTWQTDLLGDFTVARAGGQPLYNFASIVDDVEMKITHVVRAEEHLSNTHPQVLILEALGATRPAFAHVPFVAAPGTKSKLSKRNPPPGVMVALSDYEAAGYLPEALVNALARLGWSLDDKTELMPLTTIIANFSLDRITKAPAALDMDKIFWIQDHYMRALPPEDRVNRMLAVLEKAGLVGYPATEEQRSKLARIIDACAERLKLMNDVLRYADYVFRDELLFEPKAVKALKADGARAQVETLRAALSNVEPFDAAAIEAAVHKVAEETGVGGKINHALRAAATGRSVGAGVFESVAVLGREKALQNFSATIAAIDSGEFPMLPAEPSPKG